MSCCVRPYGCVGLQRGRGQGQEDLGFTLEMTALDSDAVTQRAPPSPTAMTSPTSNTGSARRLAHRQLQAMDVSKIANYDMISGIFRNGKLTPDSVHRPGHGAPHRRLVEGPGSTTFTDDSSGWMTLIPTIYNADTLGIRPDLIGRPIESWSGTAQPRIRGQGVDPRHLLHRHHGHGDGLRSHGREHLWRQGQHDHRTNRQDDRDLHGAKQAGQFRAFWKTFDESVNLMASGEVVIQSMWSPAITAPRPGIPCVYQPLKEGYRSWGGGIGLSAGLSGLPLDAAYEYINWYLSCWFGGFLMRQGYYSAVPETSKLFMSEDEWGFWFEGKPRWATIVSPQGQVIEKARRRA